MRFDDSRVQTLCKLACSIFSIQGVDRSTLMVGVSRNGKSALHEVLNELISDIHIRNQDLDYNNQYSKKTPIYSQRTILNCSKRGCATQ